MYVKRRGKEVLGGDNGKVRKGCKSWDSLRKQTPRAFEVTWMIKIPSSGCKYEKEFLTRLLIWNMLCVHSLLWKEFRTERLRLRPRSWNPSKWRVTCLWVCCRLGWIVRSASLLICSLLRQEVWSKGLRVRVCRGYFDGWWYCFWRVRLLSKRHNRNNPQTIPMSRPNLNDTFGKKYWIFPLSIPTARASIKGIHTRGDVIAKCFGLLEATWEKIWDFCLWICPFLPVMYGCSLLSTFTVYSTCTDGLFHVSNLLHSLVT